MNDTGKAAAYPYARTQVHRLVRNAMLAGETAIRRMGVADQEHLPVEPGQQVALQLRRRQGATADHGIDGLAAAVARDQNAVVLA
ncbi:hypothetical protein FG94_02831 [Massilia sp. LC238]|nr:hypothetical protein FG94_02831 [Massilia sp. LC238]